ncbi:MAG: glycosyltransferase [Aurantimonas endophytica]|uniref:glycosyltransferase family 2 protein n=1 Tax=Aurantimonas endophytica TaxID=1522175 RepID=UPI003002F4A5
MFKLRKPFSRPTAMPQAVEPSGDRSALRNSVSVVIPLYNHGRYIEATLRSAMSQGQVLREIIVVDDGSSDDSLAVAQALAQDDERLIVWSQPNQGAHAAINHGMARATGEFVAILNSDDIFETERLATLAALLIANPGSDLAASGLSFIDGESHPIRDAWYEETLAAFGRNGDIPLSLVDGNFLMTTSNFLFRRSLISRIGGFRDLRYAHDLDFLLRIQAHGGEIMFEPRNLMRYRRHQANTINEQHGNVRAEWAMVAAIHLHEWMALSRQPFDARRLLAFERIFERHQLSMAVHLVLAKLRTAPTGLDATTSVLNDRAFLEILREAV